MLFPVSSSVFVRLSPSVKFSLGMVGVGGLFVMGGGYYPETIPQALGAVSVLLAAVNVAGGFVVTKRMLDMFKRMYSLFWAIFVSDTKVR